MENNDAWWNGARFFLDTLYMIKYEAATTNAYHMLHKMASRSFYSCKYWILPNQTKILAAVTV